VTSVTDDDADEIAIYEYDAFGNVITPPGAGASLANEFRFSTKKADTRGELIDFGFRWYDPEVGRWTQRDPLGVAGGLNLYAYCNADPVNLVDPWGLQTWWKPPNWQDKLPEKAKRELDDCQKFRGPAISHEHQPPTCFSAGGYDVLFLDGSGRFFQTEPKLNPDPGPEIMKWMRAAAMEGGASLILVGKTVAFHGIDAIRSGDPYMKAGGAVAVGVGGAMAVAGGALVYLAGKDWLW
jgi:RHS repeat-associated protein